VKCVGDSIRAIAIVKTAHAEVELTLAGCGEVDKWIA
jgi:hypothetical protein